MLRTFLPLTAAVALVSFAAPLAAQTVEQDVRCWMVSNIFAKTEKDAPKRQLAGIAAVFYLGRVDARLSPQQLKAASLAQAKTMKQADIGPTMNACATRLRDKERALQAIGGKPAGK